MICWTTAVHSEAATIFATTLADVLAADGYLTGNDNLATVSKAFHAAKAAVLEQVQLSRLRGVGPIGTPLYTFLDPKNGFATYQECPCANGCQASFLDCGGRGRPDDERFVGRGLGA